MLPNPSITVSAQPVVFNYVVVILSPREHLDDHFWSSQLRGAAGIQWVETRDAAKHPTMITASHNKKIHSLKMQVVSRLRNPALHYYLPLNQR